MRGAEDELARWRSLAGKRRTLLCLGDSITGETLDSAETSGTKGWVDQVSDALCDPAAPRATGFRGMWRPAEWYRVGAWKKPRPIERCDVVPFSRGWYSSGTANDLIAWRKPTHLKVSSFDLYWFRMFTSGEWQYRVDNSEWRTGPSAADSSGSALRKLFIDETVSRLVYVRGFDGTSPCVASIAGITPWPSAAPEGTRTVIHNLGCPWGTLRGFCRSSLGDPLAIIDDLRPDAITVLFSNDLALRDPYRYGDELRALLTRARKYAEVLLMSPFEQQDGRVVEGLRTTAGSDVLEASASTFVPDDLTCAVIGPTIPLSVTVAAVLSDTRVQLSAPATADGDRLALTVGLRREPSVQAEYRDVIREVAAELGCALLDLYEEWAGSVGPGWDAARRAGLVDDALHPSQRGHDDIAGRVMALLGGRGG